MSQAPYQWERTGNCPSCGAPIYGRIRRPGHRPEDMGEAEAKALSMETLPVDAPEAKRTCPPSCPHGLKVAKVAVA